MNSEPLSPDASPFLPGAAAHTIAMPIPDVSWSASLEMHDIVNLRVASANVNTFLPRELRSTSAKVDTASSRMHVLEAEFVKHDLHMIGIQKAG